MSELKDSCVEPAKGILSSSERGGSVEPVDAEQEGNPMRVAVGKEAPDFEVSAFEEGGFKNVRLSDYRGSWVVLCFYPGDFTFV